ncbi:bifunctional folylpolyglutamate synthase/dihydrofolate synthase [Ruminococcaceae bacterium OttesenSCG-928-A16]|nr:bifunctional folylpolyglutamate synthase/dihydrofolate synthase [Ruminococcaceae bacterium OttesenSCG-928-A16]
MHSLGRMAATPGLERMRTLMQLLGNPQHKLKFVHVAGTNGKGSTVVMLASVLKYAGYKVGANISPYVLEFRERFQINGEMIAKEELAAIFTQIKQHAATLGQPILEFEAVTAAAFVYFARAGCNIVCLETGLGGRWDATNIVNKTLVACITHIGYDHTELLGNTLAKIAAEKCGILKKGCTVVSYPAQPAEAAAEIARQAEQLECTLLVPPLQEIHYYKGKPFERTLHYNGYKLHLPFAGLHQAYNAAVVVQTAQALGSYGYTITDNHLIKGIETATFPARIELLSKNPLVVLDGAHNEDSVIALANTLQEEGVQGLTAVVGALKDKEADKMLKLLAPFISTLYTVQVNNPRAVSAPELAAMAKKYIVNSSSMPSVKAALQQAMVLPSSGVLVCGSLYLAAEARALWSDTNQFKQF